MNKGICAATGELVGLINSDDWYEPIAVETAVAVYQETAYDMFYADINLIKEIGYKEISDYLDGSLSYDEMMDKIKQETRRYAKRQITWFKNKMNCVEIINDENAYDKIIPKIK